MILSEDQKYRLTLVTDCWKAMKSAAGDDDIYWDDALEVAKFVYEHDDSSSEGDDPRKIKIKL